MTRPANSVPKLEAARAALFHLVEDPVYILDPDYAVLDLNEAARRLAAGPAEGRPIGEALPGWGDLLVQFDNRDEVKYAFFTAPNPSGWPATLHFEVQLLPLNESAGYLLYLHNVTENRQVSETLRHTESRFYSALNSVTDAYYEAGLDGTISFVNDSFARTIGVGRHAIVGRSFRHVVDRKDFRRIFDTFNAVYRTGEPVSGLDFVYRRHDGSTFFADMSVALVHGADGQPAGFRGLVRDVTERIMAQRALREAASTAEAANRTKGVFLATVSHELRTPLTSVLGFAKLIKRRLAEIVLPALPPDNVRAQRAADQIVANLDIIVAEGNRLTALISDLLDLAKIESGKMQWAEELLAISQVVQRAVAATAALVEARQLHLAVEVQPDLPLILGDADRLVQVVINLISNAVKFTPSGTITCKCFEAADQIVVQVIDSGIGIAPEHHQKIFEEFIQIGDTMTSKPSGTGLGLPICRQIIEHHGGRIWVESEPGRGSTFTFTLPIDRAEAPDLQEAPEAAA